MVQYFHILRGLAVRRELMNDKTESPATRFCVISSECYRVQIYFTSLTVFTLAPLSAEPLVLRRRYFTGVSIYQRLVSNRHSVPKLRNEGKLTALVLVVP